MLDPAKTLAQAPRERTPMPIDPNQRACCGNCLFYQHVTEDFQDGYCRRYPPVALDAEDAVLEHDADDSDPDVAAWLADDVPYVRVSYYPNVSYDEWCGEWQEIPR